MVELISFFIVIALILAFAGYRAIKHHELFVYDGDNPFRRFCRKCGACQCEHHYAGNPRVIWWEEMYPIGNNPDCECHSHADNHG